VEVVPHLQHILLRQQMVLISTDGPDYKELIHTPPATDGPNYKEIIHTPPATDGPDFKD